jgi:phosphomannomutase
VSFKGELDGWFLIRMSVHDPIMPINFESNVKGGDVKIAKKLLDVLNGYSFLNTQKLKDFINS